MERNKEKCAKSQENARQTGGVDKFLQGGGLPWAKVDEKTHRKGGG